MVCAAESSFLLHPSSAPVGKRFTPNSFNVCLAYSSNFCHHHKRRHLRRSEARALTPPLPSHTRGKRELVKSLLVTQASTFLFIYDFVPENRVFVIGYLIYSSGFHCNLCSILWVYIDSTCTHVFMSRWNLRRENRQTRKLVYMSNCEQKIALQNTNKKSIISTHQALKNSISPSVHRLYLCF